MNNMQQSFVVRCVGYKRDEHYFTIGKEYTVCNGRITNDNGYTYSALGGHRLGDAPATWWLAGWYEFEVIPDIPDMVMSFDDLLNEKFK